MIRASPQTRGLAILLFLLIFILALRLTLNPRRISDTATDAIPTPLADKLDPNTADESDLAAIPGLGEKRAAAIVQFRQTYAQAHAGTPAFHRATDLEIIPGIGAATAANLAPYLKFP